MAKSLEDTTFYRYHRLLALNEVGGDPAAKALSVDEFHGMMQARAREWPHGMTATATHDTKRGEDARARIMALAEIPGEWTSAVARWKLLNAPHLSADGDLRAPSATFEYMLYQALLGAWQPDDASFAERMQEYALKAAREGKQETSWLNPHAAYEAGVKSFIEKILDPSLSGEFLNALQTLAQRLSLLGALNSLSQITLKAMMPGVPDFYQGTELWDFSLVDPDNRRPVDFAERAGRLDALEKPDWDRLVEKWPSGHLKLAWTRHLLKLRTELADVFTDGDYEPLEVSGPHRDHFIAFARRRGREAAIIVVTRWFAPLTDGGRHWPGPENYDAALDVGGYAVEGFADADATQLRLSDLLAHLPVAVLKARFNGAAKPARKRSRAEQASAFLGQQQLAAVLDRGLGHLGKALQQPRQHDFHLHMILRDIDMAGRRLPERANAKNHAVVFPSLLIDAQHRHAGSGARQPGLQAAHGFVASEAMRDGNHQRFGHRRNPLSVQLHVIARGSKRRGARLSRRKSGTFRVPVCCSVAGRANTTALPG